MGLGTSVDAAVECLRLGTWSVSLSYLVIFAVRTGVSEVLGLVCLLGSMIRRY